MVLRDGKVGINGMPPITLVDGINGLTTTFDKTFGLNMV
jgi:hypothetical protein